MIDNTEYRDLVLGIYQAVSDPNDWQSVLDRITELVNAKGCLIFEWNVRDGGRQLEIPLMSSSYKPEVVQDYFKRFQKWEAADHDIFDNQLLTLDNIDLLSEEILYSDQDDYLSRPHVKELLSHGVRYRTGALLDKDNPYRARFSLSMGEDRGPFVEEELELLNTLLPHVAKALDLSRPAGTPGGNQRALLTMIDQLNVGVTLLDANGCVAHTNSEFDRQTEEYSAFFKDKSGRLRLHNSTHQKQLTELLNDVLHHGKFGARPRKEAIVIETKDQVTSLCVEIVPLEKSAELGTSTFGGALLISRDTGRPVEIDIDLVQRVFELTKTEAVVVDLMCTGRTNSEIAELRNRSVETINAQMKSVLGKTRAVNRTQLVRLLSNFSLPDAFILK